MATADAQRAFWMRLEECERAGWKVYTDREYRIVLRMVALRFDGIDLVELRPCVSRGTGSILELRGTAERLLATAILADHEVPQLPKRLYSTFGSPDPIDVSVRRIAGGRFSVIAHVPENADAGHALASFTTTAIGALLRKAMQLSGGQKAHESFIDYSDRVERIATKELTRARLRLVVDNMRAALPGA